MPDSYNDRTPTEPSAPKPARTATASPAINASPSAKGAAAGGLDNQGVATETRQAPDSRAKSSLFKRTGAAVVSFADATV